MEAVPERFLARVTPRREVARVWEFEPKILSEGWKKNTHDEMHLNLVLEFHEKSHKRFCFLSGQVIFDYLRLICDKQTTSSHGADFFQNGLVYHMRIFARGVGPTIWSYIALVFFRIAWFLRQDEN